MHTNMKVADVLNCSFPNWYSKFKDLTVESIIIPLPDDFTKYLHTDGLVLPESSKHGLYAKSDNLVMDGDDDDKDIRDNELMKMYEDDWSTPTNTEQTAQAPEFSEFDRTVQAAIKSLGGRVFPKLNWSSPKDANWISFDKTLMCTCPSDVYLLLKSSEFIAHDLDQPFIQCEDYNTTEPKSPPISYCLVLRKWRPPDPSTEFRCFVHENRLIGACQRNSTKFYSHIVQQRNEILEDILAFHSKKIAHKWLHSSYVIDVVRLKKGRVQLIDFNPYGPVTDALLFTWDDIDSLASERAEKQQPCFRCVENEDGVQSSDYANYALPQDIQDLAAGEDPFKLMDLMKLKIQKNDDGSSSEDDDDKSDNVASAKDLESSQHSMR